MKKPAKSVAKVSLRVRIKTIHKAKKKKILDALEVELAETKDGKVDKKDGKCLTFKITLPTNVYPTQAYATKTGIFIVKLEPSPSLLSHSISASKAIAKSLQIAKPNPSP